jgi:cytochrome c-type biogenesis protein CcmH/NrfG
MANHPAILSTAQRTLPARQVAALAAVCLLLGLAAGFLLPASPSSLAAPASAPPAPAVSSLGNAHMPGPEEMKQMADAQAAPLLAQLQADPRNAALLTQLGAVYHVDHQFAEAAAAYTRAVQIDPANAALRIRLASSLFRNGDADGALAQLAQVLKADPKNANALFDLGMIRLQGKADGRGAVAAWQQLLRSNPRLSPDRKATVLRLLSQVAMTLGEQEGTKGARNHDRHKSKIE